MSRLCEPPPQVHPCHSSTCDSGSPPGLGARPCTTPHQGVWLNCTPSDPPKICIRTSASSDVRRASVPSPHVSQRAARKESSLLQPGLTPARGVAAFRARVLLVRLKPWVGADLSEISISPSLSLSSGLSFFLRLKAGSQPLRFIHYSISSVCGSTSSAYISEHVWSLVFVFMNDICQACGAGGGLHEYLNSHKIVREKQIPKKQYQNKNKKSKNNKNNTKKNKQTKNKNPGLLGIASAQDPKYKSARKFLCFLLFLVLLFLCFLVLFFVLLELVLVAAPVQSAPLRHKLKRFIL